MTELKDDNLVEITAHIVAAYVEKNSLPAAGLPELIANVSEAIGKLGDAPRAELPRLELPKLKSAVNRKNSVFSDHIVCLEDGKEFMALKKHLSVRHGLTPEEYRTKWNLPADYPMIAPNYAVKRAELAKKMGLGRNPAARARATVNRKTKQGA